MGFVSDLKKNRVTFLICGEGDMLVRRVTGTEVYDEADLRNGTGRQWEGVQTNMETMDDFKYVQNNFEINTKFGN